MPPTSKLPCRPVGERASFCRRRKVATALISKPGKGLSGPDGMMRNQWKRATIGGQSILMALPSKLMRQRLQPVPYLPGNPGRVVEWQIVPRRWMLGEGHIPVRCESPRTTGIDQSILRAGQNEQRGYRFRGRCFVAGSRPQLPKGIARGNRILATVARPLCQCFRTLCIATGESQNRALAIFGISPSPQDPHKRQIASRPETMMKRTERAQAGVDQDAAADFFRVTRGPGHRRHGTERHRQYKIGGRDPPFAQLGTTAFRHLVDPRRTRLVIKASVARQVDRIHLRRGTLIPQDRRKISPMAAFPGQPPQQDPCAHEPAFPYQCCKACSRYCSRAFPDGIQCW